MSVMCVVRLTSLLIRCEQAPSPVMVGVNTLWPFFSSRSDTRRQHQPPCQAPCTSTKVFRAPCAAAGRAPVAASAPAAIAPTVIRQARRGAWFRSLVRHCNCPALPQDKRKIKRADYETCRMVSASHCG